MTEQNVIRVLLLAVLVWHLAVCWCLFVRDWPGRDGKGRLRRWKKPKRRKRQPKRYRKPKPVEGLTRKPVCALCEHGESKAAWALFRMPPVYPQLPGTLPSELALAVPTIIRARIRGFSRRV